MIAASKNNYVEAVRYIESFSNTSMRKNYGKSKTHNDFNFFLHRTRFFFDLIKFDTEAFKYVHVTGTAGKGSVSTMIHEALVASGKKVGLFTSPYVTTSIEKIKVNDLYISPGKFVSIVNKLKPFIEKSKTSIYGAPSAFELFFIISLLYFKESKCEWVVLEVGLGGRYDATNVIKNPVATVITTIDYDHTEILGKTLNEIAFDKAGIIKKGGHFFTAEQRPQLKKMFFRLCKELKVQATFINKQKEYREYNKELVRSVCNFLKLTNKSIEEGIERTKLPCRFEEMQLKPRVILDGAHNRAKIRATISRLKDYAYKDLWVILAISDTNKDQLTILKEIMKKPNQLLITQTTKDERRSVHPEKIKQEIQKHFKNKNPLTFSKPKEALGFALKKSDKDDLILVTGSFFLAGELRKKWYREEWVLTNRKSFK
jgi:dihydrofolate synthase / folylpolyglutamate synthase